MLVPLVVLLMNTFLKYRVFDNREVESRHAQVIKAQLGKWSIRPKVNERGRGTGEEDAETPTPPPPPPRAPPTALP